MGTRGPIDLVGFGYEGYPVLLFLSLFAWHTYHSRNVDARSVVREFVEGSEWFKRKVVVGVLGYLDSAGYLYFKCQSPVWRPMGWRRCPRDWEVTVPGYARLQQLLANLGLTVDDVLKQPSPSKVKELIDSRIREIYRGHWERVRAYEVAVSNIELSEDQTHA
jgi:hypothetical protein